MNGYSFSLGTSATVSFRATSIRFPFEFESGRSCVYHSSAHTPTTCFETFPFPDPTDAQRAEIAAAAKELDALRTNWLNPPEWTREEILEFPGSVDGPWKRYITPSPNPSPQGGGEQKIGLVRYPRLVPKDEECAKELKKRTLTNLYNQRPTWLDNLHKRLDAAVAVAYGWAVDLGEEEVLGGLLELNLGRAAV